MHTIRNFIEFSCKLDPKRMDYHIELTKNDDDPDFNNKAKYLSGETVNIGDMNNWGFQVKAFVFFTPSLENLNQKTHITIGFWRDQNERPSLDILQNIVKKAIDIKN